MFLLTNVMVSSLHTDSSDLHGSCCVHSFVSPPAAGGLVFCCCFFFISDLFLTISVRQIISKSARTNLHQIFRVGITQAVEDQSEICFSIHPGTLPWQPIFGGCIHIFEFW